MTEEMKMNDVFYDFSNARERGGRGLKNKKNISVSKNITWFCYV